MTRPLSILVAGGWYQVVNRGHRGSALFLEDADRHGFLGLLAELPDRFGLGLRASTLSRD